MDFAFLIPARAGSKRIPGKNRKLFCGKPIITYPIETAIRSGLGDVWVSSDDPAMLDGINGARFLPRPPELADDYAETEHVVEHFLQQIATEWVCVLYPTSVFVSASDITVAHVLCVDTGADAIMSCVEYDKPPQTAMKILHGRLILVDGTYNAARTQDLEPLYYDAAQFYILRSAAFLDAWREGRRIKQMAPIPYPYLRAFVHDIDYARDWQAAEEKYRSIHDS